MAEYIERGLLLRNIKHNLPYVYHMVASLMACIPSADVAPVVHARWIPIKLYGGDHAIKCSACNNCDNPSKVPGRYCWQCGAQMDGEAE